MGMQAYLRIGVALTAIVLPPAARAQNQPPPLPPTMEQKFTAANVSGTGCLTFQEAKAAHLSGVVKQFGAIDLARHGCVTLPEIKAYRHGTRNLE